MLLSRRVVAARQTLDFYPSHQSILAMKRRLRIIQSTHSPESSTENKSDVKRETAKPGDKSASFSEDYFAAEELAKELVDPQQFGKRGEGWFFAQLAVVALMVFPPMPLQGLIAFAGTLSLSTGIVFMLYAVLSLGRNLSPLPQPRKNHSLITSGMYQYVRHPMYSGLILASFGFAAVSLSEIRLALSFLLWYILEQKVGYEEEFLLSAYPEYENYQKSVKKFFPFIF